MSFHDDLAAILAEGLPYKVFPYGGSDPGPLPTEPPDQPHTTTPPEIENPDGWIIRCYDDDGDTVRLIQYEIDGTDFNIHSLYIGDEPNGEGHILRIAAEAATLFKDAGLQRIRGNDFQSTEAGRSFDSRVERLGSTKEGQWTSLDIDKFQNLRAERENWERARQRLK